LRQRHSAPSGDVYPAAIDEFRRAPIRRFPFEIFYELTVDTITIYSVFTAHKIHKSGASVVWQEVLDGVREIKAGRGKRTKVEAKSHIVRVRMKSGLSQAQVCDTNNAVFSRHE
jgi:hypothetical protein